MAFLSRIRESGGKVLDVWRHNARLRIDSIIACAALGIGYFLAVQYDAMDVVVEYMEEHESWELDELFFLGVVLAVVLSYFVVRRLTELTRAVNDKANAEREAQNLARHDVLTGLPNRRKFFEELRRRASESREPFAVFITDLDHFKTINDFYGHRAGDEVLASIAQKLVDLFPAPNLVARLGGDEFAVLIDDAFDREATQRMAHRLTFALHEAISVSSGTVQIGGSTGIAIYPADGETGEVLVHSADCAMYQSKASGRSTYHFFQKDMDDSLQERITLEQDLEVAIRERQIVPYYQQIVELPSQRVIGYEVLARWHHPTRGLLSPALFIPIAEDGGKLTQLSLALMRQVCADAATWPEHLFVSVNVAANQLLDPGFLPHFMAILTGSGISPRRIQLEITESGMIERVAEMKRAISQLHGQGMKIGLDDFGTGYSGLYHLRELKFDVIKIDRSFVTDMLQDKDKARIVEAVVNLASSLNIKTTAEGVETEGVCRELAKLGCETVQGYLFGKPHSAGDVAAELAEGQRLETGEAAS